MALKPHTLLLLAAALSVAYLLCDVSATGSGGNNNVDRVTAWQVVQHPDQDPHMQELAQYAIAAHNAMATKELMFEKVIKVEHYYATGIVQKLVIMVKDHGITRTCEAVVWVKPGLNYKELTSFKVIA